jgi:WASH complex subunit 7
VPSLCLSWIDASLVAKDSMFKNARVMSKEMYYTDDGFAMGVAYCLAILKQTKKYESLHWFDTLREKQRADSAALEDQRTKRAAKELARKEAEKKKSGFSFFSKKQSKDVDVEEDHEDYEEVHTLQLTGKRLELQRRETDQLFYSLSGAGIFFKRTDNDT